VSLLQLPDALVAALFVAAAVGLGVAGLLAFHQLVPAESVATHRAAAADTFTMVALLYAVIVGSVVASDWTRYAEAEANATREANILGTMLRFGDSLPEPTRTELVGTMVTYARDVVEREWPAMGEGQEIEFGTPPYEELWNDVLALEPASTMDEIVTGELADHIAELGEERRVRVVNAQGTLALPLWILFVAGGALSMFYTYLFTEARGIRAQALLIGLLAGLFGFVLYLLWALQYPYSGALSVPPEAFEDLIALWSGR
jgi:hypothetical protein